MYYGILLVLDGEVSNFNLTITIMSDMSELDMTKIQRARTRMKGAFDENRLAEDLVVGAGMDPEEIGMASREKEARAIAKQEQVARDQKLEMEGKARLAALPSEIATVQDRVEVLKKNLDQAKLEAQKPGKMQKILLEIVAGIESDISAQETLLGDLRNEREFFSLQLGEDEANKQ